MPRLTVPTVKAAICHCGNALRRFSSSGTQRRKLLVSIAVLLMFVAPVWAQVDAPKLNAGIPAFDPPSRKYLFGDWGGARSALEEKGITFDVFYIADLQANPTGGKQQTEAGWERIRGTIDINFDRIMPWQGLRFHATGLWQVGSNLGAKIGTIANPSDLVSAHASRLDSWWLEQNLLENKIRIRAGQLAGFDFYGNQEYGGSWLMEPLGYAFGNLFSASYESFNPAGTPGVEVRFRPKPSFYVKAAALAGNRDEYNQDPTGFEFRILNTPDFVFESGYLLHPPDEDPGKRHSASKKIYPGVYKFGAAYNAGKFADPAGHMSGGNYLLYGMASQAVYRSEAGSDRGLDTTFGFDWTPGDVVRQNVQLTAGARFNAPFARRPKDRIDLGFVYSRISDPFRNFGELLGGPRLGAEKAFEANYSLQVTPYILLQPTVQYYVSVGANRTLPNALVAGFRTKITF